MWSGRAEVCSNPVLTRYSHLQRVVSSLLYWPARGCTGVWCSLHRVYCRCIVSALSERHASSACGASRGPDARASLGHHKLLYWICSYDNSRVQCDPSYQVVREAVTTGTRKGTGPCGNRQGTSARSFQHHVSSSVRQSTTRAAGTSPAATRSSAQIPVRGRAEASESDRHRGAPASVTRPSLRSDIHEHCHQNRAPTRRSLVMTL